MNEDIYLMWLSRIDGIGLKKLQLILDAFESAKDIFYASRRSLKAVEGLNEQIIYKINSMQSEQLLGEYYKQLKQSNCRFISKFSGEYPELLKEIQYPPIGLYVTGQLPKPEQILVSIVGSRFPTEYGSMTAFRLSKDLAFAGVTIISGMARGIDSMAHKGALEADGITAAVLGCGVDIAYPYENRILMEKIKENGCIISEYPPNTKPNKGFFPARNRIISGLSLATIVVEAGKNSGTLITVREALDQGREVMAVPGNITSKLSVGTNALIKEGAAVVTSYEDVLNYLGLKIIMNNEDKTKHNIYHSLAPEEKLVYDCIHSEPLTVDAIVNKVNALPSTVNYVLTMLELKQCVQRLPGQRYVRS